MGVALVDFKILNPLIELPQHRKELPDFLDGYLGKSKISPGGTVSNILSTFIQFYSEQPVRLFYAVGDDLRGRMYTQQTDKRLGKPQVISGKPTGLWVTIKDGSRIIKGLSYYGAAKEVVVPADELLTNRNVLFVADITGCKIPHVLSEIGHFLSQVDQDNGIFALNMGGAKPGRVTRDDLRTIINGLTLPPQIIFANESEITLLADTRDKDTYMKFPFLKNKLLVVTRGNQNVLIRFGNFFLEIPVIPIPNKNILDEEGAGDAFMGIMLADLMKRPFEIWTVEDIARSAKIAVFGASLIMQTNNSRMTQKQVDTVKQQL